MKDVVAGWRLRRVPICNGVIEPNGCVHHLGPFDPQGHLPRSLPGGECSRLGQFQPLEWTHAITSHLARDPHSLATAIVGECGMGADGFVAMQETEMPESLLWIAFFDFSNPFESVRVDSEIVAAQNNLGEEWRFDRRCPWLVEVHQS